jgi:hypothetical protein
VRCMCPDFDWAPPPSAHDRLCLLLVGLPPGMEHNYGLPAEVQQRHKSLKILRRKVIKLPDSSHVVHRTQRWYILRSAKVGRCCILGQMYSAYLRLESQNLTHTATPPKAVEVYCFALRKPYLDKLFPGIQLMSMMVIGLAPILR